MPRYIDADKLLEEEKASSFVVGVRNGKSLLAACKNYLKMAVDNAPTVDVVEVVRCKKCKHFRESKAEHVRSYCTKTNLFFGTSGIDPETFFCRYGEKE